MLHALLFIARLLLLLFGIGTAISLYVRYRIDYLYGLFDKENYNGVYSKWGAYPLNERTNAKEY